MPATLRARVAKIALVTLALAGCTHRSAAPITLRFWAMGREGEVVSELVRDFERENPGVRVRVQQIPWSAAHEKLLTAFVGDATPDLAQLGNTWIAEFAALRALEPLDPRLAPSVANAAAYFPGIWDTNVIEGVVLGVPWYVDTRLLFYRRDLFARAGYDRMPDTWEGWRAALAAVKRRAGRTGYALFLPPNEYEPLLILGLATGSRFLADGGTRGAFSQPEFRRAFAFYASLYRDDLAPPLRNNEIANIYQEFARGYFATYIGGPWILGEFERRLPAELQDAWATAPMPGPDGPASGASMAGGSSLVVFRGSRHKPEAWRLVEFLSRPDQQLRFYRLTGDLPARVEAWRDRALTGDPRIRAFGEQLTRTVAMPTVPEWELIANRLRDYAEQVVRGGASADSTLAALDREVDRLLEKRRWLAARRQEASR
ncbi:MAG TPA: sugar ABC transporter substrate-binding protein [Candidatus Eisenbacteria bacterium]